MFFRLWLSGGMADAGDLKSLALNGRAGSSPALAIKKQTQFMTVSVFLLSSLSCE